MDILNFMSNLICNDLVGCCARFRPLIKRKVVSLVDVLPREEECERERDEAVVVVPGVRLAHRHLPALVHAPVARSLPREETPTMPPARSGGQKWGLKSFS